MNADRVGSVPSTGRIRMRAAGVVVADLPLKTLIDGVPLRSPAATFPDKPLSPLLPSVDEPEAILLDLIATPNLRSRRPIYRTYFHTVLVKPVFGPAFEPAYFRLTGTLTRMVILND